MMKSMNQAMTWEFFARNGWTIVIFPVLANTLALLLLGALNGYKVDFDDRQFVGLGMALTLLAIFKNGVGLQWYQGAISRYYAKPISTTHLVSWFYLMGITWMLLTVGGSIGLWNLQFDAKWPILGPAFFSAMLWGLLQPCIQTSKRTEQSFIVATIIFVLAFWWYIRRHGQLGPGVIIPWSKVTPTEFATMLTFTVLAYVWTLRQVARDRCGLSSNSMFVQFSQKLEDAWSQIRKESTTFRSPEHALQWLDWESRTKLLPSVIGMGIVAGALVGAIFYFWSRLRSEPWSGQDIIKAACMVMIAAIYINFLIAFLIGIVVNLRGRTAPNRKEHATLSEAFADQRSGQLGSFISALPVTNTTLSNATLRSLGKAVATSACLMCLAAGLILLAAWFWNIPIDSEEAKPKLELSMVVGLLALAITVVPWVILSNTSSVATFGLDRGAVLLVFGLIGLIVSSVIAPMPTAAATSVALIAVAGIAFRYTLRAGMITKTKAAICLLAFALITSLVIACQPSQQRMLGICLAVSLASMTVLPFATTPIALRFNRTR